MRHWRRGFIRKAGRKREKGTSPAIQGLAGIVDIFLCDRKEYAGFVSGCMGDLEQIYGEKSDITTELAIIVTGMENNIKIEDLLTNFAQRSGLEDIASFADVFVFPCGRGEYPGYHRLYQGRDQ